MNIYGLSVFLKLLNFYFFTDGIRPLIRGGNGRNDVQECERDQKKSYLTFNFSN